MAKFAFIFLFRQRYIHEDIPFTYRCIAWKRNAANEIKSDQSHVFVIFSFFISLSLSLSLSFSFSPLLLTVYVCLYTCARVCTCWITCNSLFSRRIPSTSGTSRHRLNFFISPLPVFAFRNSPSLHHRIFYFLYLIIISTMPAYMCTCVYMCACVRVWVRVYVRVCIYVSILFFSFYHIIIFITELSACKSLRANEINDTLDTWTYFSR